MRTFYIAAVATLCLAAGAFAQTNFLKNAGFESWTSNVPDSWISASLYVTKSTTVHGGSSALKLGNYSAAGFALPGEIIQTTTVSGSSFSLKGWYQLKADSGDGVLLDVVTYGNKSVVGAGEAELTGSHTAYTAFALGVSSLVAGASDSATVSILMSPDSRTGTYHITAYALFDDLVLDNTVTGVPNQEFAQPVTYQLSQNYPNPFNPATQIEFTVPREDRVTLKVYDIMGREVETLVNERMPQGRYRITFDGSRLASGMFFYRIEAGSFSQVKRMTLVK